MLIESMPPVLKTIRLCRIRVFYRAVVPGRVDGFLGPEIRRGMGKPLKAYMGCSLANNEDCRQCSEARHAHCVFAPLFYDHDGRGPKGFSLGLDPAFRGTGSRFAKGETLQLDLVLVGDIIQKGLHILNALKSDPLFLNRIPFILEEAGVVVNEGFVPLHKIEGLAVCGLPADKMVLKEIDDSSEEFDIHLLTPTELAITHKRYVRKGEDFTFERFVIRMLDRVERLASAHCGWVPKDAKEKEVSRTLIDRAGDIKLEPESAKRCPWIRISVPKTKKYWRGGLTGRLRYKGNPVPYLGLLEAARQLGVGRTCTHGLGNMSYEIL